MKKLLITLMMLATMGFAQAQTITVGNHVVVSGRPNIQVGGYSLRHGTFETGNVQVHDVSRVHVGDYGVRVTGRNRDRVYVPYRRYRRAPGVVEVTRNGEIRILGR